MTSATLLRCLLVATMLLCFLSVPSTAQVKGCPITSIYTFGDGDSSTSDGSTMSDHLASAFHLPSPKRYDTEDPSGAKSIHGATFATAEATVMNTAFFVERDIQFPIHPLKPSLDAQIESFADLLISTEDLDRAIFFLDQFGGNDYKLAFLQRKSIKEVSSYVPMVVAGIKKSIRKLINAGATHLFVTGIPPMGCLPGYLALFQNKDQMRYDSNNCHRGLDTFTRLHDHHLQQALAELRLEFPHLQIVYGDYYKAFMALLRNRVILGFRKETLMKACCGLGDPYNFHPEKMCGNQGVKVCSNPTEYVHWDGFHLTQEALKHVVEAFMSGRVFVYPEFKFPVVMHCRM